MGEYGTGDDYTGTGSDGLDDDILPEGVLAFERAGKSYRYYRYRYSGFKYLSHLQAEEGGGSGEYDGHHQTYSDRPYGDFRIYFVRSEERLVLLSRLQLPERVLGKGYFFLLFHKY